MRKNLVKNVLRTSAFALACVALSGAKVKADAMTSSAVTGPATSMAPGQYYSTSGSIGTEGMSTSNGSAGPIGFRNLTNGFIGLPKDASLTDQSNLSLGGFTVSTLADGASATYKNTPFSITYNPVRFNEVPYGSGTPITITGHLDGSVTGNQSGVRATFTVGESPEFTTKDLKYKSTLTALNSPLGLVPSTTFDGLTSIQGRLQTTLSNPTPAPVPAGEGNQVPEPTTFAILATSLVGLGLRQRLRARKTA